MQDDPSGWTQSARPWIEHLENGDLTREVLLDGTMLRFCGDVRGKTVLDVGCGEGRFCRFLTERGAAAIGLDPTIALLNHATSLGGKNYLRGLGDFLPIKNDSVDLVVFYLVLIDIPNFRAALKESVRVLKPGGKLVIGNIAPHASTSPAGWVRDQYGERLYFPIDHYSDEYGQEVEWRGIKIINYHRPLSAYLNCLLDAGLTLERYEEPVPTEEQIRANPSLDYSRRVPYVHAMLWFKS